MDEKMITEIASVLKDIRDRLGASYVAGFRGPVADPGPEWFGGRGGFRGPFADPGPGWFRGPVADPMPWPLLEKARVAKLRVRQIEAQISDLEKQIDMLKLEQSLLREEHQIK